MLKMIIIRFLPVDLSCHKTHIFANLVAKIIVENKINQQFNQSYRSTNIDNMVNRKKIQCILMPSISCSFHIGSDEDSNNKNYHIQNQRKLWLG